MRNRITLFNLAVPPLILLTLFAQFVRFHNYPVFAPEILLTVALLVLIGIGLAVVVRLRPITLEPLLLSIMTFALLYPQVSENGMPPAGVSSVLSFVGPLAATVVWAAGLLLFIAGLGWLLRENLGLVLTTVFSAILVSTLALPTPTVGGGVLVDRPHPSPNPKLPPVIHIILDEHIGIEGVPTEVTGASEAIEEVKATYPASSGFALYGRAYSRFAETQYSIATMMNGDVPLAADRLVRGDISHGHTLLDNLWFERLSEQGYQIRVYQSVWMDFCARALKLVHYCYTYPSSWASITPLQHAALPTTDKMYVVSKFWLRWFFNLADRHNVTPFLGAISSMETFNDFANDFLSKPFGNAYVVHLLMPHLAYVYDKECNIRRDVDTWLHAWSAPEHYNTAEEREQRYLLYLQQLTCTNRRIGAFFDNLKEKNLFEESTVIVHGDHGSRIATKNFRFTDPDDFSLRDLADHFSTLFAVKAPHIASGYRDDVRSVQSLFAEMFLGQDGRPRADDTVFMRMMHPHGSGSAFRSRTVPPGAL